MAARGSAAARKGVAGSRVAAETSRPVDARVARRVAVVSRIRARRAVVLVASRSKAVRRFASC